MINVAVIAEMTKVRTPTPCAYQRLVLPLTKRSLSNDLNVQFVGFEDLEHLRPDVIISHRTALSTSEQARRVIDYARSLKAKIIYDLDDDLMAVGEKHPEFEYYRNFAQLVRLSMSNADQIWVSTRALADRYANAFHSVVVLPAALDARVWRARPVEVENTGIIRFVHMGTSTHRPNFYGLILPGFERLVREFGAKVSLDVIGILDRHPTGAPWKTVTPPAACTFSYPVFATWLQSQDGYSVGLAPLIDDAFNTSKSPVKLLEYSALGLATIAADLAPYRDVADGSEFALLVEPTAEAFYQAMRGLVIDPQRRRNLQNIATTTIARLLNDDDEPRLRLIEQVVGRAERGESAAE